MYVFRKKNILIRGPLSPPLPINAKKSYYIFSNDRDVYTKYMILIFKLPEIFLPSFTVQDFMTIISIYKFFRHFRLLLKRHTDRAKVVYTSLSSRLSQFVRGSHKFCHNWFSFFEDDGRFSDPKPPAEEEPD